MTVQAKILGVREKVADFLIDTPDGKFPLYQWAARHKKLILTTQDSYRYHPN
jgi:hypothetical protein